MTRYPREAGVIEFTPDSLKNLPDPPKFLIRTATPRDRLRVDDILIEEGLRQHSTADMRAEMLRGLEANWSPEIFAEYEGRIKAYWDALDQYDKIAEEHAKNPDPKKKELPDFEHPDQAAMEKLTEEVNAGWHPLRRMTAQIVRFNRLTPDITASVLLKGWRGLDVPYAREAGVVPLETMWEVREAVSAIESENGGKVEGIGAPGTAYVQLAAKCAGMIFLTEQEEKNSASPSPSSETPSTSKEAGKDQADGSSTAKSSPEIPAT